MTLPTLPEAKEKVVSWSSKNLYAILAVLGTILAIAIFVLCVFLNKLDTTVEDNPPLTNKAATAIRKEAAQKEKAAEVKLEKSDSLDHRATRKYNAAIRKEQQTDSLLTVNYEVLRTRPATPFGELQFLLTRYGRTPQDTAR